MLKLSVPCAGCESTLRIEIDRNAGTAEQDRQIVAAVVAAGWEDCGEDALCDECAEVLSH